MMTRDKIESEIFKLTLNRDVNGLRDLKATMESERKKLDVWFDRYLDMFDKDMKPEEGETAIWQLYRKKYREYSDVDYMITRLDYQVDKVGKNASV